jgi:VWFA-related protein
VKGITLTALWLLATANPLGQSTNSTFTGGVDVVALNVVVIDKAQRFVSGLTAGNFAVYEDGVQQQVSLFAAGDVPLDLAIVLDTSASMIDRMPTARQAAIGFTSTLRPDDRVLVMDVKDTSVVAAPLSGDLEAARAAIRRTLAGGGTALYNGLYLTLREMEKERRRDGSRRQALVMLTDGADTSSLVSFRDVMELAQQSNLAVYAIMLREPELANPAALGGRFSDDEYEMKRLTAETGGRAFSAVQIRDLAGVYKIIGQDLSSQYALGYMSTNQRRDGGYRRVTVRVVDRPGALPRTRAGYLAPRG